MIVRALRYLFCGQPVQFDSALTIDQAVAGLQAATVRIGGHRHLAASAVGEVAADHVSLEIVWPGQRNAFAPVFTGAFRSVHGQTRLEGAFAPWFFARVFMALWLLFASVWTLSTAYLALSHAPQAWWFPLVGLALWMAAVGMVELGRAMGHGDAKRLSALIQGSLAAPQSQAKGSP